MFFEVEKDLLLEGLSKTVPITEKRTSLPILSHILMEVSESELTLTATDLEVGLRITCASDVKESVPWLFRQRSSTRSSGSCPRAR